MLCRACIDVDVLPPSEETITNLEAISAECLRIHAVILHRLKFQFLLASGGVQNMVFAAAPLDDCMQELFCEKKTLEDCCSEILCEYGLLIRCLELLHQDFNEAIVQAENIMTARVRRHFFKPYSHHSLTTW